MPRGAQLPIRPRRFALVAGRWESTLTVVDIEAALAGQTAIVARIPTTTADPVCALPVSIAFHAASQRIFVVNHAGQASPEAAAAMPHGHPGTIAVIDAGSVAAGDGALVAELDCGGHGPVGCALTSDGKSLLVGMAEGAGTEDGGHSISVFSTETLAMTAQSFLPHTDVPSRVASPDRSFGGYPNPNGLAIFGDKVLTANGGTDDISVLALGAVLQGDRDAEKARIPVRTGPFGIAVSPTSSLAVTADRESAVTGVEGNTVSFIDLSVPDPVAKSVLVGTRNSAQATRPFVPVFSPDGSHVFVTCQRANALARLCVPSSPDAPVAGHALEILRHPTGMSASPRGLAITRDGRMLAVSGGPRAGRESGVLWLISADRLEPLAVVPGVGDEPYLVEIAEF